MKTFCTYLLNHSSISPLFISISYACVIAFSLSIPSLYSLACLFVISSLSLSFSLSSPSLSLYPLSLPLSLLSLLSLSRRLVLEDCFEEAASARPHAGSQ